RMAEFDRPEKHRAIIEVQRQRDRALAFERGLLAEQIDAERKIAARLLARDRAKTGQQAVELVVDLVHVRRGLHRLLCVDRGEERFEAGHGDAYLAVQPAFRIERQTAAADRDGFALLHARLRDVDAPACRLHLAETHRPGLGREIFEPAQQRGNVGVNRMRCGRMQGGRRRPGQPRHDLDHRIAGGGAFDDAAVDFDAPGVQQVLPRAAVDAVDHRAVEHQRHALRRRRRTAHARLAELPIGNDARRFSRIGDGQRALEFGDQQVRLINLRGDQHAAGLDLDRRLVAVEQRGGFVAIHLDAERIAADALRAASIDPAGLGLARAPAVDGDFRLAGGVVPEPAPAADQHDEQNEHADIAPGAPARGAGSSGSSGHRRFNTCRLRRFCALTPEPSARGWVAPEHPACYASASRRALSTAWSKSSPDEHKIRSKRRGPVGFRLWIADVAAGIRFPGAAQRPPGGRPPGALRLFLRPSRHAGTPRPGARPRPRRQLPRHRLSGGGGQARGHDRLFARARAGHQCLSRSLALGLARRRPAAERTRARLYGGPRPPAICRPPPATTCWRRSRNWKPTAIATTPCAGWPSSSRASTRRPPAKPARTTASAGGAAQRAVVTLASAIKRAVAVSRSCWRRLKNASLSRPGWIGSRISTSTVPGRRRIERRGQNRPELSAIGTQGTPSAAYRWAMPNL